MALHRRTDPGHGSGPARYPGTFLLAFREALAGLNWQARRWLGPLVECVDAQGREQVVGLENVYRRARLRERGDWPELIAEFLRTVSLANETDNLPKDLASAAEQLLLRLGPPLKQLPADARVWSQALTGTPLCINLVVDYPNRMCYVTEQLVADSGRAGAAWLEQALANLMARTPASSFQLVDEECGLRIAAVADAYDSSRALLLDTLLPEARELGSFVAVPGRDHLLVLPVSREGLASVPLLKLLAEKTFQTTPYPITRDIFWVKDGVWHPFTIQVRGDEASIDPPEEFLDIMRSLVPLDDPEPPGDADPR